MKKQPYRRPWHFWCITLIALFFYAIGSYDFINVAIKNEYYLSKMYTPEGVAYFLGYPLPLLFLFGLNIAAGLSGILLALFHPKISWKSLLLSGTANTLLIFITVTFMDPSTHHWSDHDRNGYACVRSHLCFGILLFTP